MTIAIANGYVISHDETARRNWESARARVPGSGGGQTVAEFRATAARWAAAFPGAVRIH